ISSRPIRISEGREAEGGCPKRSGRETREEKCPLRRLSNVFIADGRRPGRNSMKSREKRLLVAAGTRFGLPGLALILASALAGAQEVPPASQQTPLMDRQKEIALALSACPTATASKAGVYVLENAGYVKVRESQNGFTAIVQHALPNSQEPQCMDAEGTRTHLPRILKVAELRAQGKSRDEIKRFVADAFARGIFQPPTRPGIDYMLSTENIV